MIEQEQLPMVAIASMNDMHLEDLIIINKLSAAAQKNDLGSISTILNELVEHTIKHFESEEKLMRDKMFPTYNAHKEEHNIILNELKSVTSSFQTHKDSKMILTYIEETLTPWLVKHISTLDTATAEFLKSNGDY